MMIGMNCDLRNRNTFLHAAIDAEHMRAEKSEGERRSGTAKGREELQCEREIQIKFRTMW